MIDPDDLALGASRVLWIVHQVVEHRAEVARAGPDVEHAGARLEEWEEVLRRMGVLRGTRNS